LSIFVLTFIVAVSVPDKLLNSYVRGDIFTAFLFLNPDGSQLPYSVYHATTHTINHSLGRDTCHTATIKTLGGILKKMAKSIVLLLFSIFGSVALGQQNEELIRIVCDTTNFSVTNFPPKLNMTTEQLEAIINKEIAYSNQRDDSVLYFYICAVIKCEGSAEYKFFNDVQTSVIAVDSEKIIKIFKSNCQWTPGKLRKDYYEKVRVRKGNKYVYEKRKVIEYVHYTFCMKFEIKNGRVSIKSKINTT